MNTIKLYTRTGQFIAIIEIPFDVIGSPHPIIIAFQGSYFVQQFGGSPAFTETYCLNIPRT